MSMMNSDILTKSRFGLRLMTLGGRAAAVSWCEAETSGAIWGSILDNTRVNPQWGAKLVMVGNSRVNCPPMLRLRSGKSGRQTGLGKESRCYPLQLIPLKGKC